MSDVHKIDRVSVLIEALPYIRAFSNKTIVIKYGGSAMTDPKLKRQFAEDVVLMKYVGMNPVVVHGGGPAVSSMLRRLGKEPQFAKGLRVTDSETMEVVEMVLGGTINKEIVTLVQQEGGCAVGLTGIDGSLILAEPFKSSGMHVGQVGRVKSVNPRLLRLLFEQPFIPVIAPIGTDAKGKHFNINADDAASAVAIALSAEKLLFLTDVPGIIDGGGTLLPTLSKREIRRLTARGVITKGMLPKVRAATDAIDRGVCKAHIIDGRVPHALLLEIFTDSGVGTEIVA